LEEKGLGDCCIDLAPNNGTAAAQVSHHEVVSTKQGAAQRCAVGAWIEAPTSNFCPITGVASLASGGCGKGSLKPEERVTQHGCHAFNRPSPSPPRLFGAGLCFCGRRAFIAWLMLVAI